MKRWGIESSFCLLLETELLASVLRCPTHAGTESSQTLTHSGEVSLRADRHPSPGLCGTLSPSLALLFNQPRCLDTRPGYPVCGWPEMPPREENICFDVLFQH